MLSLDARPLCKNLNYVVENNSGLTTGNSSRSASFSQTLLLLPSGQILASPDPAQVGQVYSPSADVTVQKSILDRPGVLLVSQSLAQIEDGIEEGRQAGYFVRNPDGSVWQWDRWPAGMALVDFTNPAAVHWFKEKLRRLIRMGVDTFKTDFGERIPTDVVYHDGSDPVRMHNYYTHLYNQSVFDLLVEAYGVNRALVFARSATVGGQMFPVHWGGDCTANYGSMAESLHGSDSYRVPWLFDLSADRRLDPLPDRRSQQRRFLAEPAAQLAGQPLPGSLPGVLIRPDRDLADRRIRIELP